jgi:quercetin dioxygenase-like cupin family protein
VYRRLQQASFIVASLTVSTQAFANQCPEAERMEVPITGAPAKPVGAVPGFAEALDLGPELSLPGRELRMRQVTLQPGGRVPAHSHQGRPSIMYVLSGEATEHSSRCRVPVLHKAGDTIREGGDFQHWWQNTGKEPTILIVSEVTGISK